MITSPTDFTAYLSILAAQLPDVEHVVTGEGSRQEESTLNRARYPQVLIETPEVHIPVSEEQRTISTRIYVLAMPAGSKHADEDIATDRSYKIAEAFISAIRAHSLDEDHGFSLVSESIDITPVIARGSDQLRGWTFDIGVTIDQYCGTYDPDTFFMPLFDWYNSNTSPGSGVLTFTDRSVYSPLILSHRWLWQEEIEMPVAESFSGDTDTLTLTPVPDSHPRIVHVWLYMEYDNDKYYWAYARIDCSRTSGSSVPFTPIYPF